MSGPNSLYTVDHDAYNTLRDRGDGPLVMFHMLEGFLDAGATGKTARTHLTDAFYPQRIVAFDTDDLHDYRARRPVMTFETDRWSDIELPHLRIDMLTNHYGDDFLLLHGAEPDMRWMKVADAIADIIEDLGITLVAGIHGIPMGVPHTRAMSSTAHATRDDLIDTTSAQFGVAKVPASFGAYLEYRLGQLGIPAIGYAVHIPHYLAQSTYPAAALYGMELLEKATGLDLASGELTKAAGAALDEVAEQVGQSDEAQELVRSLEQQYDAFMRSRGSDSLLGIQTPVPSADELAAEFEAYLSRHNDPPSN